VPYFAATELLTGSAKKLFVGVKRTRDGMEVKLRDQDAALHNLARYLGMFIERKEITGANGQPIAIASLKAEDLTDDQLAALIAAEDGDMIDATKPKE
jgi:phage terminase small subunit